MKMIARMISWGVDYEGSTRSAGLIRLGLAFLIWARFGNEMLPMFAEGAGGFAFRICYFVATFAMAAGIWSRLACAASALCLGVIYFYYGHFAGNAEWAAHHIYLLFVAAVFLAFTPAGRSYAFDRWIAVRRAEKQGVDPPMERGNLLGLRLIALQLVAIYFWGAVGKMTPAFLSGQRFQHFLYDFYSGVDFRAIPGFELLCAVAGSGAAFFELALVAGLLAPGFRRLFIPLGIAFHLIIYLFFPVLTFSLTMVLLYLAFIPADDVYTCLNRMQGIAPDNWKKLRID